jgi:hypothetical protein
MRRLIPLLAVLLAGVFFTASAQAGTQQPDQVIQWNQTLLQVLGTAGAQPATVHPTRSLAIVQIAVYDAVNAIDGSHRSYLQRIPAPRSASADAAAASAAHDAMLALFPSQKATIDAKLADSLSQLGSGWRVQQGIKVGKLAAKQILDARANDGSNATPPTFTPGSGPGEYQLTPPNFQQPVFTHWPKVKTFALASAAQFRPPPPPAVDSPRYTASFNEVKAFGDLNSTVRSADQTEQAKFWSPSVQSLWNQIAETAGTSFHDSLAQNARLFALLDISLADDVIGFYDAKYAYHFWRPVTAIRAAGTPDWTPLLNTPLDPTYPGAHAVISGSAAAVLRQFFGTDRLDFSLGSSGTPGVTRSFQSFSQASDEASESRIFAGAHFRFDLTAGAAQGDQIADFVLDNVLRPHWHGFEARRHAA